MAVAIFYLFPVRRNTELHGQGLWLLQTLNLGLWCHFYATGINRMLKPKFNGEDVIQEVLSNGVDYLMFRTNRIILGY